MRKAARCEAQGANDGGAPLVRAFAERGRRIERDEADVTDGQERAHQNQ